MKNSTINKVYHQKLKQTLFSDTHNVSSLNDIKKACNKITDHFEIDYFIYGALIPLSFTRPLMVIVSSYPDEWRARYDEQDYLRIDPTVSHCRQHVTSIVWSAENIASNSSEVIKLFDEAHDHGLCSGVSVPQHSSGGEWGMLSLASQRPVSKTDYNLKLAAQQGQLILPYLHEIARNVILTSHGENQLSVMLTKREDECLRWAADGKSAWEVGQIIGITERTVNRHIEKAMEKLGVHNRQHAIAKAALQGIIHPPLC